jgi:hypothetical protein
MRGKLMHGETGRGGVREKGERLRVMWFVCGAYSTTMATLALAKRHAGTRVEAQLCSEYKMEGDSKQGRSTVQVG